MTAAQLKALVLARSWGRCECCGAAPPVDVHHRQPRGMGGVSGPAAEVANQPSNLLAVCRSCHEQIDAAAPTARQYGWLVPHPTDPATVPTFIYTTQGHGWWLLDEEGGFNWPPRPSL